MNSSIPHWLSSNNRIRSGLKTTPQDFMACVCGSTAAHTERLYILTHGKLIRFRDLKTWSCKATYTSQTPHKDVPLRLHIQLLSRRSSIQITAVQILSLPSVAQGQAIPSAAQGRVNTKTQPDTNYTADIKTPFQTLIATNCHTIETCRIAYVRIQFRMHSLLART